MSVPVNEAIGLTFARALRAFLRQDPDRIMVGETRDSRRADFHPGITHWPPGFTTLHTNDAPGAITRLIDMGVEPFLISSRSRRCSVNACFAHLSAMPDDLSTEGACSARRRQTRRPEIFLARLRRL
jgi:Flp pilus assembly CpaF family ATPase